MKKKKKKSFHSTWFVWCSIDSASANTNPDSHCNAFAINRCNRHFKLQFSSFGHTLNLDFYCEGPPQKEDVCRPIVGSRNNRWDLRLMILLARALLTKRTILTNEDRRGIENDLSLLGSTMGKKHSRWVWLKDSLEFDLNCSVKDKSEVVWLQNRFWFIEMRFLISSWNTFLKMDLKWNPTQNNFLSAPLLFINTHVRPSIDCLSRLSIDYFWFVVSIENGFLLWLDNAAEVDEERT